jgi:hypothetical protein
LLERLLDLLMHAKAGAVAGVFVLGTTGALVTATVQTQNGTTTITLTQASPTPSASPATANTTQRSSSLSSQAGSCSAQAHLVNEQVQRVNSAFSQAHESLEHADRDRLTSAARDALAKAGQSLKQIRESAVQSLHATLSCSEADEDNDQDEDKDEDKDEDADEHEDDDDNAAVTTTVVTTAATTTSTNVTSTTTADPKAIADQAIAAMKLVVDSTKATLATLTPAPRLRTAKPTFSFAPQTRETREHERD